VVDIEGFVGAAGQELERLVFRAQEVEEGQVCDEEEAGTVREDEDSNVELERTVEEGVEDVQTEET